MKEIYPKFNYPKLNTNYHFVKCTFSKEKLPVFGSPNDRRGDKEKAQVVGVMTYGRSGIEGAEE